MQFLLNRRHKTVSGDHLPSQFNTLLFVYFCIMLAVNTKFYYSFMHNVLSAFRVLSEQQEGFLVRKNLYCIVHSSGIL